MKKIIYVILIATLMSLATSLFIIPEQVSKGVSSTQSRLDNITFGELAFAGSKEWNNIAWMDEDSAQIIVGFDTESASFNEDYSSLRLLLAEKGGTIVDVIRIRDKVKATIFDIPFESLPSFTLKTQSLQTVRYVEPNLQVRASLEPNDPFWDKQWGPKKIQASDAWNTTIGNSSILIAVVDTGIDWNHSDLATNYVEGGYDWVNDDNYPMDDYGHGTHCAGIIAAEINNNIGIAGLAQVEIMAEKVLNEYGSGYWTWVANGIIHAVDEGADIISLSLGSYFSSNLQYDAIKYAHESGVLLVAAAGNDKTSEMHYPAAYDEVIAVTATDENDEPSDWSYPYGTNYGNWVEIAAPGTNIYSTVSEEHNPYFTDEYSYANGTSMACPHIAGVAALIWSQFPEFTRDQIRVQLRYSADDLYPPGFDENFGYGRVNAKKAVTQALPSHDLLILNWQKPPFARPGSATFNVFAHNFGSNTESNVALQLFANETEVDSENITSIASGQTIEIELEWAPGEEGTYEVVVQLVPVPGETITVDNSKSAYIPVRSKSIFQVPQNYSTIQAAIDAAKPNDVIIVAPGTYNEHFLIGKSLTLIADKQGEAILDGDGEENVIDIKVDDVDVIGFTIKNATRGIRLSSKQCAIIGNTIRETEQGITLHNSANNLIIGNDVDNLTVGITLFGSIENIVAGNNISANDYGLAVTYHCMTNKIYHNNFLNNTYQAVLSESIDTTWANGYPSGGNYWSNYNGSDLYSGQYQNETGSDGIGDTPYTIQGDEEDSYPLMQQRISNLSIPYMLNNPSFEERGKSVFILESWNATTTYGWRERKGDIDSDGDVDIYDIVLITSAYGSEPGDPNWDPRCDLNGDDVVNIYDVIIATGEYGETSRRIHGAYSWFSDGPSDANFWIRQDISDEAIELESRTVRFSFMFRPESVSENGTLNQARANIHATGPFGELWWNGSWVRPTELEWYEASVVATLPSSITAVEVYIEGATQFNANIDFSLLTFEG